MSKTINEEAKDTKKNNEALKDTKKNNEADKDTIELELEDTSESDTNSSSDSLLVDDSELDVEIIEFPSAVKAPSTNQQGRKQSPIWSEFLTIYYKDGKIKSNKCKHCKKDVSKQPCRMKTHLDKCTKRFVDKPRRIPALVAPIPDVSSQRTHSHQQSKISSYLSKITQAQKSDIDKKLGKYVFTNNLSFNTVESPEFQEFVHAVNPSYQIPSHEVLGDRILDEVYHLAQSEMKSVLTGKRVAIAVS